MLLKVSHFTLGGLSKRAQGSARSQHQGKMPRVDTMRYSNDFSLIQRYFRSLVFSVKESNTSLACDSWNASSKGPVARRFNAVTRLNCPLLQAIRQGEQLTNLLSSRLWKVNYPSETILHCYVSFLSYPLVFSRSSK